MGACISNENETYEEGKRAKWKRTKKERDQNGDVQRRKESKMETYKNGKRANVQTNVQKRIWGILFWGITWIDFGLEFDFFFFMNIFSFFLCSSLFGRK